MSTMLQQLESQLTKVRWALGLSGALSIALGVVILVWPSISLFALVIVFGAYTLARGLVGLGAALNSGPVPGRGWLIVGSVLSIVVGALVFAYTDMSALALLYVIGAYAIALGIMTVGGAFWLPLDGRDSALLGVTGVVSILFGIVMFAKPGDGALVLLALIAAYALIVGAAELTVAIGGKRLFSNVAKQHTIPANPQASQ